MCDDMKFGMLILCVKCGIVLWTILVICDSELLFFIFRLLLRKKLHIFVKVGCVCRVSRLQNLH